MKIGFVRRQKSTQACFALACATPMGQCVFSGAVLPAIPCWGYVCVALMGFRFC